MQLKFTEKVFPLCYQPFVINYRVIMKEREQFNENLDLAIDLKKAVEYEDHGDTYDNWNTRSSP